MMKQKYLCVILLLALCSCNSNKTYKETIVKALETNSDTEVRTDLQIKFLEFSTSEITVADSITILEDEIDKIEKDISILDNQKTNIFSCSNKKETLEEKLKNKEDELSIYKSRKNKDVIGIKVNCRFSFKESKVSAKKEMKKELILSPDGRSIYYVKPDKAMQQYLDQIKLILDY